MFFRGMAFFVYGVMNYDALGEWGAPGPEMVAYGETRRPGNQYV